MKIRLSLAKFVEIRFAESESLPFAVGGGRDE